MKILRFISLSFLPLSILCSFIIRYAVDIPFWDEWEGVDLVSKYYSNSLTFHDFWKQNNEHRLLVPRIITLINIAFLHWNIYVSIALNVLLAITSSYLIFNMIERMKLGDRKKYCLFFSISWILFSCNQAENWLWGFQFAFGLSVLFAILSIYILSMLSITVKNLLYSSLAAIISIYSSANGLLIFPIGILIFSIRKKDANIRYALIWMFIVGIASACYFIGYHSPLEYNTISHNMHYLYLHPDRFVAGFCRILSLIFIHIDNSSSVLIGFVGICWQAILIRKLYAHKKEADFFSPCIGFLMISLYFLLVIGGITFGRFSVGGCYVLRYIIFSQYFWISLICQTFAIFDMKGELDFWKYRSIAVLLIMLGVYGCMGVIDYAEQQYRERELFKHEILSGEVIDPEHFNIYIFPRKQMISKIKILKDNHIRNFENACYILRPDFNRIMNNEFELTDNIFSSLDELNFDNNQIFLIKGWCIVSGENNQFNKYRIILNNGEVTYYSQLNNEDRIDLVNAFPNESNVLHCGFSKRAMSFLGSIDSGEYDLFIGVENPNGKLMCPLNKKVKVP